jgi:hypothetical protein
MTVAGGALTAESFRQVMGRFATGVTIVTSRDRQGAASGLTASALTSVALAPPLVLVRVDRSSQTLPTILEQRRFRGRPILRWIARHADFRGSVWGARARTTAN